MGYKKFLFGPVPSRRFGRSLGVDLIPYKTCTLDCVFCQLGRTSNKTLLRKKYAPVEEVLKEIKEWLKTDGKADYITLSGSGEPTLHEQFGEVLAFIRDHSDIPSVLLTNGTLLYLPEVRQAASLASVVKVSLSAWDQASYMRVNRPHPELLFSGLIEGQKAFRSQFKGSLWMEVFLIGGMNSAKEEVNKIASLAEEIAPARIHLNTAVRPPAEGFVTPLSRDHIEELTQLFNPPAEVIAEFSTDKDLKLQVNKDTVLAMLRRRPCTAEQIADGFGMHLNEVSKYLGNLIRADQVRTERKDGNVYYEAVRMGNESNQK